MNATTRFRELLIHTTKDANSLGVLRAHDFDRAIGLISQGLDYQQIDEQNRNVFTYLISNIHSPQQLGDNAKGRGLIGHMLDYGFEPLLAATHNQCRMFTHSHARRVMEGHLARLEVEGKGKRDSHGGNFYHSFALHAPEEMCSTLNSLYSDTQTLSPSPPGRKENGRRRWLDARNQRGQTPLHVLWSMETLFEAARFGHREVGSKPVAGINQACANVSWMLHLLGVDMLAVDGAGCRAGDLIGNRNLEGVEGVGKTAVDMLRAMTERRQLEEGTPPAPSAGRIGVRRQDRL